MVGVNFQNNVKVVKTGGISKTNTAPVSMPKDNEISSEKNTKQPSFYGDSKKSIVNVRTSLTTAEEKKKYNEILVELDGKYKKKLEFALKSGILLKNNSDDRSSVLDNHIAYIQIISFMGGTTPNEFLEALENTKNTDSIIIDLRGNTGGLLDNAVFIANMFISKGEIVEIIYRNGHKKSIKALPEKRLLDKPIVVLVNSASASASEILSGALKDYKKATLVGKKTFGKGLVQKIVPLPNQTGVNITIARYLTPNGVDIHKQGIKPDIEIGNDYDFYLNNNKNDIQLEKAKEILNAKN